MLMTKNEVRFLLPEFHTKHATRRVGSETVPGLTTTLSPARVSSDIVGLSIQHIITSNKTLTSKTPHPTSLDKQEAYYDHSNANNNSNNVKNKLLPPKPCRMPEAVLVPCQTCRFWKRDSDTQCPRTAHYTGRRPWPVWNWPAGRSCSMPSSF